MNRTSTISTRILTALLSLSIVFSAVACGNKVRHKTSEDYTKIAPRTIAVLPVIMPAGMNDDPDAPRIKELFRLFASRELAARGYEIVPQRAVDAAYVELGGARFKEKGMENIARAAGADAVLAVDVEKWSRTSLGTYVSLKVAVECSLFSSSGKELWRASQATKDFDITLDKEKAKLDIIKAFDPRIESMLGVIFMTLPPVLSGGTAPGAVDASGRKYFDWLP